ncbi:ATP-dependent DNA helicase RecG [soil metagenome]
MSEPAGGVTEPISLAELSAMDVSRLKGVGPKKADALAKVGVETLLDVLTYYPLRYVDRSKEARISDLRIGEEALVLVQVQRVTSRRTRGRPPKVLVNVDVTDGSGHLSVSFFNQGWRERQLHAGMQVALFGKLENFRGRRQMTNPVVDLIGDRTGRIVPIYPQSEKAGINTYEMADWVAETLRRCEPRGLADPVPATALARWGFVGRTTAFRAIHTPDSMPEMLGARRRLVFDELLRIQLALVLRKRMLEETAKGIRHATDGDLVRRFHERLPFQLTEPQRRVVAEIEDDLSRAHPMHRLLQGDVGSGKTVVAISALLVAVQGGHQGALMVPTEVLAEQHFFVVKAWLDGFSLADHGASLFGERPLRVELLTNRTTPTERRRLHSELAGGTVDLLIGTHALIEEGIDFRSLGVVVIDEQHRFGVEQRAALRAKGPGGAVPDVLVMTATPIPRTAAMTVYGDLDVSLIDQLPKERERTRVTTVWERVAPGGLTLGELEVWATVRAEVAAGRQAYVVCPLIEESEKLEVRSAQETYDELSTGELAGLRLGLLHGRVPAREKEQVMSRFRAGELDVLVATTVIEVGVHVPNATVMVVLDADRFGIAQLHQLRGRVGRGGERSWCFLVAAGATPHAETRLQAMVTTTDGFVLAEVDLDLRGEGTIMGERQKGRNDLKLASLRRDREWVERAREAALGLVESDPTLSAHPDLLIEIEAFLGEEEREYLLKG